MLKVASASESSKTLSRPSKPTSKVDESFEDQPVLKTHPPTKLKIVESDFSLKKGLKLKAPKNGTTILLFEGDSKDALCPLNLDSRKTPEELKAHRVKAIKDVAQVILCVCIIVAVAVSVSVLLREMMEDLGDGRRLREVPELDVFNEPSR